MTEIRPATADDAPFIAGVIQEAARSHLSVGVWDLAFPGDDAQRLEMLARCATTELPHFIHYSRFLIAEVEGESAAALSAYENATQGVNRFAEALVGVFRELGWGAEKLVEFGERLKPYQALGYPNPDDLWIIEWVATGVKYRGRGIMHQLLNAILDQGRERGFSRTQIGYLLGNLPAKGAYEAVGFEWIDEYTHEAFDQAFGSPGIARMQRDL
jgi:GNAT superfamily N-acetyltransferase